MSDVGRNDPCPCGSGRKYKKCHGAPVMPAANRQAPSIANPQRLFDEALSLHQSGLFDDAEVRYNHLLSAYPDHPHLLHNLGLIRFQHGRLDAAIALVRRSLQVEPGNPKFQASLGAMLSASGNTAEAIANLRRSVDARHDDPEALANLALALGQEGHLGEAISACERSLQLRPNHLETLNTLGGLLTDSRRYAEAAAVLRAALTRRSDAARLHSNLLLLLNYNPDIAASALMAAHRAYGSAQSVPWDTPRHTNTRDTHRQLRIAYVSGDLAEHPVGYLLRDVLGRHERSRVAVTMYLTRARADDTTARFRAAADAWHDVSMLSDNELELQIRRDGIDILVDLSGHTAGNRLPVFARRPAPVQISYLGYTTSTGLAAVDYRLSDAWIDPPGEDAGTEQVLRLTQGMFRYSPPANAPEPAPPPILAEGVATFGCFCNLSKVSPRTVQLWCLVLQRIPAARLVIKAKALADAGTRQALLDEFAQQGVASARITLLGWTGHAQHLADYGLIDVMLDTLPFNLTANACEALWMGVPVVTRVGDRPAGRIGASLLTTAGCGAWIADSDEAFVDLACHLVENGQALSVARHAQRERLAASALMDAAGLAAELDTTYRDLWARWCADAPQAPDAAEPRTVLHVGCGSLEAGKLPTLFASGGWRELRLDIDDRVKPDFVASITDMRMVPDQLADALYSSHNVEHLQPHEVQPALREFARVLRNGGFVLVVVPDLQLAAQHVLEDDLETPVYQSPAGPVSSLDMIYGQAASIGAGNLFMMHKMGFTAASLQRHLLAAGFERVTVQRTAYALWAVGHKSAAAVLKSRSS